jgi:hypothetical protein
MPGEDIRERIRREWRELGFYYDRNDETKSWRIVGSRSGLLRFREILLEYADDTSNDYKSEHEHYGPHWLKIMTWPEPGFDEYAIRGSLPDLKRLADIVGSKLTVAKMGETICIRDEFAVGTPYSLTLEIREDGFDPAHLEAFTPNGAG